MMGKTIQISILLLCSGFCALVYEVVWMREFRLIFGATTQASSTVLAIFMGGIGIGSFFLGKKADSSRNPLSLYGFLELFIALYAVVTPFLIGFVRDVYWSLGGAWALGDSLATLARIALSVLILGVPTFLMGGTLPAAVRSLLDDTDVRRRGLGFLYSANTLGAVLGAAVSNFYLLPLLGARNTLWMAGCLNVTIALAALLVAGRQDRTGAGKPWKGTVSSSVKVNWIYASAAIAGFVFFLMELVWFRILGTMLGGTTYTFGLILAVTLSGIGLGGLAYSSISFKKRPTLNSFALTCSLEGLLLILPFAIGDHIAILGSYAMPIAYSGIAGKIIAWGFLGGIVIFPGALIAGFQFPLLAALLGEGQAGSGDHTGKLYFWNTMGSISGSLAGGFFLIPLLSATLCWKLAVYVLTGFSMAIVILCLRTGPEAVKLMVSVAFMIIGVGLSIGFTGPTAIWRHTPPDFETISQKSANSIRRWKNDGNKNTIWEKDGKECGVAIRDTDFGLAFIVNGKSDGSARGDAGTQVMLGMVSAILHPAPKSSLVIGLGTGSSAGWLADVPSMEHLDCVEIEPVIRTVAEKCAKVNRNVLKNPKVEVIYTDGREILFSSTKKYDLIVSEPSNPYRPGIASLFTTEFYKAVASRLEKGGIFSQWLQYYNIDQETVRIVYHTLQQVFPHVETWQTKKNDLLLICSLEPIVYQAGDLRKKIQQPLFMDALNNVWRVVDLEGFLAHFVADDRFSRLVAEQAKGVTNTDDRTIIEYQFADSVGVLTKYNVEGLRETARQLGMEKPSRIEGVIDWNKVSDARISMFIMDKQNTENLHVVSTSRLYRLRAHYLFAQKEYKQAVEYWEKQEKIPQTPYENLLMAQCYAELGDSRASFFIDRLAEYQSVEAGMIHSILLENQGKLEESVRILERIFENLRDNPWPFPALVKRVLELAKKIAKDKPEFASRLFKALSWPFAVNIMQGQRYEALFFLALQIDSEHVLQVLNDLEPYVPWDRNLLKIRCDVYGKLAHPLYDKAREELEEYDRDSVSGIEDEIMKTHPPLKTK